MGCLRLCLRLRVYAGTRDAPKTQLGLTVNYLEIAALLAVGIIVEFFILVPHPITTLVEWFKRK